MGGGRKRRRRIRIQYKYTIAAGNCKGFLKTGNETGNAKALPVGEGLTCQKTHSWSMGCVGVTIGRLPTWRSIAFSAVVFLQGKRAGASDARPCKSFYAFFLFFRLRRRRKSNNSTTATAAPMPAMSSRLPLTGFSVTAKATASAGAVNFR